MEVMHVCNRRLFIPSCSGAACAVGWRFARPAATAMLQQLLSKMQLHGEAC
jgi:hypothetical protein